MAEYTQEQLRELFLTSIRQLVFIAKTQGETKEDVANIVAISMLSLIDGVGRFPLPIDLVVQPHLPEDQDELVLEGEPYLATPVSIADGVYLHDLLYKDREDIPQTFYPQLIKRYRNLIEQQDVWTPSVLGDVSHTSTVHLLHMLNTLETSNEQSLTKKHRWLGYIQGILIAKGLTTVNEERAFTRHIFNGA